jgi:hypothetical protein
MCICESCGVRPRGLRGVTEGHGGGKACAMRPWVTLYGRPASTASGKP